MDKRNPHDRNIDDTHNQETEHFEEKSENQDNDDIYEREMAELRERSQRRRQILKKSVAAVLVLALLVNVVSVWPQVFNWTAFRFIETSYRLYQDEEIKQRKEAVVSVVAENQKGTGFNLAATGLIVTNAHVIEDTNGLYIHFSGGESYIPVIQNSLPEIDLAVLDVEGEDLPYLTANYEHQWKKGDQVYFIGNPLGFPLIANEGEILGDTLVNGIKEPVVMIKAPVYKGNSGSPVFNEQGEVIGVIFATMLNSEIDEKVGLVVPIRYIEDLLGLK
jgi:serine protease Do